jgi:hypothetical protein
MMALGDRNTFAIFLTQIDKGFWTHSDTFIFVFPSGFPTEILYAFIISPIPRPFNLP